MNRAGAELDRAVLEQALAVSSDGIVVVDARREDQPILFVNPAFERITGFAGGDAVGRNCRFLQGHDRDQEGLAELRRALERQAPAEVMLRNYRKDGSLFWNRLCLSPVRDDSGKLAWWIGVIRPQQDPGAPLRPPADAGSQRPGAEDLRDAVRIDKITGIFNRAWFDELFARDWAVARRERQPMTVMLFDIDFFSDYNETFGRQAADSCLRLVARAIQGSLRRGGDLSARYGGEEFIGTARSLDERQARALAEAIGDKIRALCIHHPKSSVAKYITVSAGVATGIPRHDQEADWLIGVARDALREAKTAGRDRVVSVSRP